MLKIIRFVAVFLLLAVPAATSPADARAAPRVEVGTMVCSLSPSIGALVGSRRRMACRLNLLSGQRSENYVGTITRLGVDVGGTAGGILTWRVFTRTRVPGRGGTIAGHYVGVSADVSLGLGVGAKVLVGGSRRSTMLQPLALVGNVGFNLALGVTGLTLRYAPSGN